VEERDLTFIGMGFGNNSNWCKMQERALYHLNCEQVLGYWKDILPLLGRIPNYFESRTPEYVLERLCKGSLQCWALSNGAVQSIILTEVVTLPEEKVFRFVGCAGEEFEEFMPILEGGFDGVASTLGCKRFEVVASRKGWSRFLKRLNSNFEFRYEILSRPVLGRGTHNG